MEDAGLSKQESGLVFEDLMPLSWRRRPTDPDPAELLAIHQSNEQVLRCLTAVEESRGDAVDDDHGPLAHDLARLDFKVNLLLDMMGRLLSRHIPVPDPVPVRISAAGLHWRAEMPPTSGDPLAVELYLSRRFPSPILLYGRVTSVTQADGLFHVDMDFGELSEPVRNWLEKLIFRQHRRQVAHARKTPRPQD
jgi:hypothetical protein